MFFNKVAWRTRSCTVVIFFDLQYLKAIYDHSMMGHIPTILKFKCPEVHIHQALCHMEAPCSTMLWLYERRFLCWLSKLRHNSLHIIVCLCKYINLCLRLEMIGDSLSMRGECSVHLIFKQFTVELTACIAWGSDGVLHRKVTIKGWPFHVSHLCHTSI